MEMFSINRTTFQLDGGDVQRGGGLLGKSFSHSHRKYWIVFLYLPLRAENKTKKSTRRRCSRDFPYTRK